MLVTLHVSGYSTGPLVKVLQYCQCRTSRGPAPRKRRELAGESSCSTFATKPPNANGPKWTGHVGGLRERSTWQDRGSGSARSLATITTDDPATPPDAKALQSNSMPTTSIGASSSSPLMTVATENATVPRARAKDRVARVPWTDTHDRVLLALVNELVLASGPRSPAALQHISTSLPLSLHELASSAGSAGTTI